MAVNKIVYGNQTLIDLTSDSVEASTMLVGATAHGKDGNIIEGTCTFDADTKDATAMASEILDGKVAYVNANKVVGTMVNRGDASGEITTVNGDYAIQSGFHDGSGTVKIADDEKAKIISGNIKSGVEILGVVGTFEGQGGTGQAKTVSAYVGESNVVLPDAGYDFLTQVTVEPIAYTETENPQGGKTVTIGTVKV